MALSKSEAAKAKFEKDFKSGKMKVNSGEIVSPGKIVAKLAAKLVAKKAAEEAAKKATKTEAARIAKNSVKVKSPAKPKGNPPNRVKAQVGMDSSAARGGVSNPNTRLLGKAKDDRIARSISPNKPLSTRQKTRRARAQEAYESGARSGYAAGKY